MYDLFSFHLANNIISTYFIIYIKILHRTGAFQLVRIIHETPHLFRMKVGDKFYGKGATGTNWWELVVNEKQDECDKNQANKISKMESGGGEEEEKGGVMDKPKLYDPCKTFKEN